jgi:CRISPR-associated protein Csd1
MSAQVTITIDMSGDFIAAETIEPDKEFTVIPCTLDSGCRSSNPDSHACNDRIDYLSGNMADHYDLSDRERARNEKRHKAYLELLGDWAESPYANPKVQAIYDYIKKDSIIYDLIKQGILFKSEGTGHIDKGQKINKIASDAFAIRFAVLSGQADEDYVSETWLDHEMFRSYISYYSDVVDRSFAHDICYVSGEYVPVTDKHGNGIRANSDFAKLISATQNGMITYEGERYHSSNDVITIGYLTSTKAHNALRWLISLQGIRNNENITVAWHGNGTPIKIPYYTDTPTAFGEDSYKIFKDASAYKENLNTIAAASINTENGNGLVHLLELDSSFKGDLKGRIAILDYKIFSAKEYYANVLSWHEKYFWDMHMGNRHFTGSPSVRDIILAAYGTEDSSKMLSINAKNMYSMLFSRIIKCVITNRNIPDDFIKNLCSHASTPQKYKNTHDRVLSVACAVINGKKGGGDTMLDKECDDRDYLFGRLLAIANYAEKLTFKDNELGRETNAIRYMSDFSKSPATTWHRINDKLQPYLLKLNRSKKGSGDYFRAMICSVMDMFDKEAFSDKRLESYYLLGYSSQSNHLSKVEYAKSKENEEVVTN